MSVRIPTIEQRVSSYIQKHRLLEGASTLVVGVSGGADSTCLLYILATLKKELGIRLHVAHLDHRLRGTEGEADAACVGEMASRLGLPATIAARDVKAYQAEKRISLEEAAREVRYGFLAEVARSAGTAHIAVGHTRDDQAETVLMHLIRGSGTGGLRGLLPLNRMALSGGSITVIRPLLEISRAETEGYCREHGLEPRADSTNLSISLFRNRLRLQLLPMLEDYNPRVREALLRIAHTSTHDLDFIEKQVEEHWDKVVKREGGALVLDKRELLGLHPSLQHHLLRRALEEMLGSLKDIDWRHIGEIMAALHKPVGRRIDLPGGLVFRIDYDRYMLATDVEEMSPFPPLTGEHPLNIPGETSLSGWRVEAAIIDRSQVGDAELSAPSFSPDVLEKGLTACLDYERCGHRLAVRGWRRGDRFIPMGLCQPKKVREYMLDAKIPRDWRPNIPLVVSPQHIVWVAGWRLDERVSVREDTGKILRLRMVRYGTAGDSGGDSGEA